MLETGDYEVDGSNPSGDHFNSLELEDFKISFTQNLVGWKASVVCAIWVYISP